MPAGEERPHLAAVPPAGTPAGEGEAPRPQEGRGRSRVLPAAAALLAIVAAVALVGWIRSSSEVDRLEDALAARGRALDAARAELRAWEAHRQAVGARLESLSGELEALRGLVERGPEGRGGASGAGEAPEPVPDEPAR